MEIANKLEDDAFFKDLSFTSSIMNDMNDTCAGLKYSHQQTSLNIQTMVDKLEKKMENQSGETRQKYSNCIEELLNDMRRRFDIEAIEKENSLLRNPTNEDALEKAPRRMRKEWKKLIDSGLKYDHTNVNPESLHEFYKKLDPNQFERIRAWVKKKLRLSPLHLIASRYFPT